VPQESRINQRFLRFTSALSHVFTVAVNEWEWMTENPMKKVKKLKEDNERVRFLSKEEIPCLLKACSESKNAFLYTVVMPKIAIAPLNSMESVLLCEI